MQITSSLLPNRVLTVLCALVIMLGFTPVSVLAVEVSEADYKLLQKIKLEQAAKQKPAHEQPHTAEPPTGGRLEPFAGMVRENVGEIVSEYRGQLILGVQQRQQTGVEPDLAARKRESPRFVDSEVCDFETAHSRDRVLRGPIQLRADTTRVGGDFSVSRGRIRTRNRVERRRSQLCDLRIGRYCWRGILPGSCRTGQQRGRKDGHPELKSRSIHGGGVYSLRPDQG
jgi:hypothetical protein